MATVVEKTGIRREKGWLYFLDKRGDVSRARMARGGGKGPKGREKVTRCGIEREEGFLYFIDKKGDVAKVKMKRSSGRKKTARKKTARKKTARKKTGRRRAAKKTAIPDLTRDEIAQLEEVRRDFDAVETKPEKVELDAAELDGNLKAYYKTLKKGPVEMLDLQRLDVHSLQAIAPKDGLENGGGMSKQHRIYRILRRRVEDEVEIIGEGALEILPDGFGFLRSPLDSYTASPDDIYVSPSQIRRPGLRNGSLIRGPSRPPREGERYFALLKVGSVDGAGPELARHKILFDNLTPLYPEEKFNLEAPTGGLTTRIIDLIAPIGKGQRALITSPPKAGKTMILKDIANAIAENHPEVVPDRAADRRTSRGSHRHAAHGQGRGHLLDLRRAGHTPRSGCRNGDREGQAPGRTQTRRRHPAGFDHASGPRL